MLRRLPKMLGAIDSYVSRILLSFIAAVLTTVPTVNGPRLYPESGRPRLRQKKLATIL
jgi:hypothetical protein